MQQFESARHGMTCPKCESPGTINKNGHTKSTTQPRPQFLCNSCRKTVPIKYVEENITINNRKKRATEQLILEQQEQLQQQNTIIDDEQLTPEDEDCIIVDADTTTSPSPPQQSATTPQILNNQQSLTNSYNHAILERLLQVETKISLMEQVINENNQLKNQVKNLENIIK
ncbi:unnamed protein product [Mucor hiemalis]